MKVVYCVVLTILYFSASLVAPAHAASPSEVKLFSGPAVSVWDLFPHLRSAFWKKGSAVKVPSPNGKDGLDFPSGWGENDSKEYTIFAVVGRRRYPIKLDGYMQPHVIWAKDSSGALLFYSDAGVNCCYETKLISFGGGHVAVADPTQQVADNFMAYRQKLGIKCDEDPNLYPIGFVDRSHAFIAAETVHHSVCACFGSIRAYEIDLPSGTIIKAFNQSLAKKMFDGNLPWDLSKAPNDNWDTNPKSCS